ncbi:MAG: hypothetical protein K0R58_2769 [Ramlibacter sp.]|jgi:hypothetical protein|nr:hypothetical protein [Ramlibacter sp.]
MKHLIVLSLAALAMTGCSEREQTASGIKSDARPFAGTSKQPPFMAPGWKQGDAGAWEQQMKVRTVQGQNEYAKVP